MGGRRLGVFHAGRVRREESNPGYRWTTPRLRPAELDAALTGLARINAFCRSAAGLASSLITLAKQTPDRPLRVLDVATGAGDVPIRIHRLAKNAGARLEIEACDISPVAVDHANRSAKRQQSDVRFFVHDVLNESLPTGYDATISSLFLHHLTEEDAVQALRQMAAAGRVVMVTDLARSRFNHFQVWAACHLPDSVPSELARRSCVRPVRLYSGGGEGSGQTGGPG